VFFLVLFVHCGGVGFGQVPRLLPLTVAGWIFYFLASIQRFCWNKKGAINLMLNGMTIRLLRAKHGLSLMDLGQKAGVHFTLISRIERNLYPMTKKVEAKLVDALLELGVADDEITKFEELSKPG
jgi:predicted transcriptional regulator